MIRILSFASILCAPLALSCIQKNPPAQAPVGGQGGSGAQVDAGNPDAQCPNGSAECFGLCGSPECALANNSIPPVLDTPVIWYQPGGAVNNVGAPQPATSTKDPCAAINDAALAIRKRSCAPCHGPPPAPGFSGFNYVLDDATLANHPDHANSGKLMVVPGKPLDSYIYQRIVTGLAQSAAAMGMPPVPASGGTGPVVYPTPADVTVLYGWILNCMPGADTAAYQNSYGSGSFGAPANPSPDAGGGG